MTTNEVNHERIFTCKHCSVKSKGSDWNATTILNALNRKARRMFIPIEKATKDLWYQCPACGEKFSRKNILEVQK